MNNGKHNLEEKNTNNNKDNNSKSIELSPPTLLHNKLSDLNEGNLFLKKAKKNNNIMKRANKFRGSTNCNTLKMIIDREKPFNYKGQIDIIVEE